MDFVSLVKLMILRVKFQSNFCKTYKIAKKVILYQILLTILELWMWEIIVSMSNEESVKSRRWKMRYNELEKLRKEVVNF